MNKIPSELVESIMNRDCVIFIGAGVSSEAGLLGGKALAQKISDRLKKEEDIDTHRSNHLPSVAQDYEKNRSRPALIKQIRKEISEKIETADRKTFALLSKIQTLPQEIFTTNWDSLIEDAFGKNNFVPIFDETSLSLREEGRVNIYKLHGDLNSSELIITQKDYNDFSTTHPGFCDKLRASLREKIFLFIGYGLEDHDFLENYMRVFEKMGFYMPSRFCIDPLPDVLKKDSLKSLNIKHIEMTARDFFNQLIELIEERLSTLKLPGPKVGIATDRNPFAIFRAEDIPEINWINGTFVKPVHYAQIIASGNVILEGHRGSGKSTILKYLSYEAHCKRGIDEGYIGIYLKTRPALFKTTRRRGENRDEWTDYFLNYMNLLIGEQIIHTLQCGVDFGKIKGLDQKAVVHDIIDLFFSELASSKDYNSLDDLGRLLMKGRNRCAKFPRKTDFCVEPGFLYDMIERIKCHVPEWKEKVFFILLDEYDNLDDDQQKVANILLRERSEPIYYKVGVKLFEMLYEDIDGCTIDQVDDFTYIPLDRFDADSKIEFANILEQIGQKRLEYYEYTSTIKDLFPSESDKSRSGYKNNDYSGFAQIAVLSSGLVRDFLELCKDMVYMAHPSVLTERKDHLSPISPKIQNLVIKVHSNILYTSLHRIEGIDRGKNAQLLIDSLGKIFVRILKGSKSAEERTVSSIQIRSRNNLNEISRNALEDCVKFRVLQVPFLLRVPQNIGRHAPSSKYEFHRLLCPRFQISTALRWPKELAAEELNQLFLDPEGTINKITKYFDEEFDKEEGIPPGPLFGG